MVALVGDTDCLSKKTRDQDVIARTGISLEGATADERAFVTRVVHTFIEMTNEQQAIRLLSGLKLFFKTELNKNSSGGCLPAHQLIRNQIHMGRQCTLEDGRIYEIPAREGILVHELGHFIANKHGLYPKYNRAVSKKCNLSEYMYQSSGGRKHKNRNEEFAEILSAYLVYPKKLKRSCRASFNFIKDELFLGEESSCSGRSGWSFF